MAINPGLEELVKDIQDRYGIIVHITQLCELLHVKRTAATGWVHKYGLEETGRKCHYYSRDIARAMIRAGYRPS